jgi:hypothetical protein
MTDHWDFAKKTILDSVLTDANEFTLDLWWHHDQSKRNLAATIFPTF